LRLNGNYAKFHRVIAIRLNWRHSDIFELCVIIYD
jgi:hypothetical protein